MYTHTNICVCVYVYVQIHTHTHTHTHTHKHTHTHLHTHAYTHTKVILVHVYICTLIMVHILTNIGEAGDDTRTDGAATQRVISRNSRHCSLDKLFSCSPGTCSSPRFMYIYMYAHKHALCSRIHKYYIMS